MLLLLLIVTTFALFDVKIDLKQDQISEPSVQAQYQIGICLLQQTACLVLIDKEYYYRQKGTFWVWCPLGCGVCYDALEWCEVSVRSTHPP